MTESMPISMEPSTQEEAVKLTPEVIPSIEAETAKGKKKEKSSFITKAFAGYVKFLMRFKQKTLPKKIPIVVSKEGLDESGSIYTRIPPLEDENLKQVAFYAVNDPFSFIRITLNSDSNEYLMEVIEPQLNEKEEKLLSLMKDTLERTLAYEWDKLTGIDKQSYLEQSINSFLRSRGMKLDHVVREKVRYYIIRDFIGYGLIDTLISDTHIEDISCDGVDIPLFVYHTKFESLKTNIEFDDENVLNSFVISLSQRAGKQVSVSSPILDGTSPEGHRIQATFSREITTRGSTFTIRRYKE